MGYIEIFSRIDISPKEIYKHLISLDNFPRYISPFFKLENLHSSNSKLDENSFFTQKCAFLDLLQLFFKIKEIVPDKKIVYQFEGLIKGTNTIFLIEDENSCILRERFDFSLYNQFDLPLLNLLLSFFFQLDISIKHLRLKNIISKDIGIKQQDYPLQYNTIRSYIAIDTKKETIVSFFDDLHKLSLWISPFMEIKNLNCEQEFQACLFLPFFPDFQCKITKKEKDKIIISFSSPVLSGYNIWSMLPCENQLIIENAIQLESILPYLNLIWLVLGNTVIKHELNNWNKTLKEIAQKANLSKYLDLAAKQA